MPATDPSSPGTRTAPLPDEQAVVARAAAGDRTAFTQLIEHYQSACYGLAWRLLGDADQAADATQDAFVHAYDAIGRFRGGVFRSWMLRITANASYDILRRAQRRPTTELPDPEEGEAELPDEAAPNPVVEAARAELYRHLDAALRLLPADQRTRWCCATCTAWTTARWPMRPHPPWERSSRGSTAAGCGCGS